MYTTLCSCERLRSVCIYLKIIFRKKNESSASAAFCFMLIQVINNMRRVNICNDKRIIIYVKKLNVI